MIKVGVLLGLTISREKTRRDVPLEFRLDLELHDGSRPCFGTRFSPKEIKIPFERATRTGREKLTLPGASPLVSYNYLKVHRRLQL